MKFINIETEESQESTQQTINYSRSDYINIDLPYDDLYLMDTVATDSFDNEPKKIELINPINIQGLDKCYQSLQYFTIDNLFSELQTSVLKELARKNLGIDLNTISVQGDIKLGVLNLSQLSNVKQAQSELTETNQIAYFIITDNSGKLPSKQTAYSVPTNVVRQLLFASPNPTALALLDIVASKVSFSPIGVNVGDLIALTRIKVKVSDLTNVIGITIPGATEIELYLYKILATNDAKPYNYNGITQGVMGLMSPWDKTEVNKISGIENIANAALPRIDYLPSKWENNMNNCLETGVYPWCTLGRPAGSTGAYTCISIKSSTDDGNYYTIEQTAYGRLNELGLIYKRIIFYKKDGTDTLYHDWINISDSFKTNYYTKDESVELFAKKTSVEANNEKISKILSGETPVEKADKLTNKRTISLSGYAVSNTPYFDGSSNVTISVNSINDRGLLLGLSAKEGDYYRAKMTPIDTANLEFSTNRLAFNNPECITIEYSNDGGNTWLDYEATDILKIGFISGMEIPFFLGKNTTALTANQDMLRIKINHNRGAYTNMQRLYIYLSTQGAMVDNSHALLCKVEKSLCKDPENLSLVGNYLVSGWSGWNSINIDGYFGAVSDNNIHTIQLTFSFNNLSSAYISKTKAKIMKLLMLGNTVFTNSTGCKLLQTGHVYDYDLYKNVIFPAKLTSTILESNIETGTAPIKVKSTTKVSNLKSEYSEKDVNGNVIHTTYATKLEVENEINRAEKIVRKEDIVNNLTDGGVDKVLSAEMGKELATTRRSGLTDNPELNKLLLELYIDPTSYPTGKTWKDISSVVVAKGYNVNDEYINSLYVYFGDDVRTVFRESFSTLDAAISNVTGVKGSINKAYIDYSTIPYSNKNYPYKVQFNIDPTIESAPTIYAHVKAKELEADITQNKTDIEQNKTDIVELRYKTASTPEILYSIDDFIEGYYIKANTIGELPIGPLEASGYAYKYVDVQEGEKWTSFLAGGSNGRAWAFLDEKGVIVDFSDTGTVERTVIVPSGVRRILFQTSYSNSNKAKYYVKRPERVSTLDNLEKKVSEIEPLIFQPVVKNIPFSDGAYTTVIGSESVKDDTSSYICAKISGIKEGETVEYAVHGGTTYRGWAKIFKGVAVSIGESFKHDTGTVVCDGSFDEMVFNFYKSYVNTYDNYVLYHTTEPAVEEVKRMVVNLKGELEGKLRTDLKILCFGNSFTQDSMSYVPSIIRNIAPNVNLVLGIAYIGGAPLAQHYANFANTDVVISSTTYSPKNYSYHKAVDGGAWVTVTHSLDEILADEEWDVITFQQAGGSSAKDYNIYYAPYINKIHKLLFDKLSRQIKIGWISIHGTYNSTDKELLNHWSGTVDNTQEVVENTGTSVVFPYGTAVQNLRTIQSVNALGDTGHLLADGGHLQDGIGCLCAAYCNALKIVELLGLNYIGVIGETTRISIDFLDSINVPGRNLGESGTVIGMTEDYVYLAQIAATKAILKPYEVTDINANVV